MVDQLGYLSDEAVIVDVLPTHEKASIYEDGGYRDEFEGELSAGPNQLMPYFATRVLSTGSVPVWHLDGGED